MAHAQHAHISSWAFHAHVHPMKLHRTNTRTTRSSVVVKAEKNGLQRLLQPFEGFSKEEEVSFRWDPANLRWAKSKGKLADDAEMMITPLIGEPYMASIQPKVLLSTSDQKPVEPVVLCSVGMASSTQLFAEEEAEDHKSRRGMQMHAPASPC